MSQGLAYQVAASPSRVLEMIGETSSPGSAIGFGIGDRANGEFIGTMKADGSFRLRLKRTRSLVSMPRALMLVGHVRSSASGSTVAARYVFHPAVRLTLAVYALLFVGFAIVVTPVIGAHPELIWVIVVIGAVAALMATPYMWLARTERPVLRSTLERVLRRAGSIASSS